MGTVCEGDGSPVDVGTGMVEMVKNFTYLGSNLSSDCDAPCEVKCRLARASKAFGAMQVPIFLIDIYLSILRDLFILLWSFPSCCMVLRHGN